MKLKYIQKEFGKCLYYCLANIFNNDTFLKDAKKEGYHMDARRIVEKITEGKMSVSYHFLHQPFMEDILREDVFTPQTVGEYYNCYIVNVVSNTENKFGVGSYLHSLIVLVDCENNGLVSFNPYNEEGKKMSAAELLNTYQVREIETICNSVDGGQMCFYKEYFNHLLNFNHETN